MNVVIVSVSCLIAALIAHAFDVEDFVSKPEDANRPCQFDSSSDSIICNSIDDIDDLRDEFKNYHGRTFNELRIYWATQYIPYEIFENVQFRRMFLYDCKLDDLFDAPPTALTMLENLHIQKTKFQRISWDHLAPLTSLKHLTVADTEIRVLDASFGNSLPKSLKHLNLIGTRTRTIQSGAFSGLDKLDTLQFKDAELTRLSRDMFPRPFNVEYLSFIENKLASLPKDLFTQMPNLRRLDLRVNELTEIPEEAFGERASQISLILLDVNPLKCDCGLQWLARYDTAIRSGVCESPAGMKGKSLHQLTVNDFDC